MLLVPGRPWICPRCEKRRLHHCRGLCYRCYESCPALKRAAAFRRAKRRKEGRNGLSNDQQARGETVFKNLKLTRPLAVIDLETTGLDPAVDRIVEISVLRVEPSGETEQRTLRLFSTTRIPPEATAVHGIRDEDVANCPTFSQIAPALMGMLTGCDLAGFNVKRFDLPLLCNEFRRCEMELDLAGRAVIDVMQIYHQFSPRDLSAAVHRYLGDLQRVFKPHFAGDDVLATAAVLDGLLLVHETLPSDVQQLDAALRGDSIDIQGCFRRDESGEIWFNFGKFKGQSLRGVKFTSPDYLRWMLSQDFLPDTKAIVEQVL
jgi:DNA polymerase-3 subunit epsilon